MGLCRGQLVGEPIQFGGWKGQGDGVKKQLSLVPRPPDPSSLMLAPSSGRSQPCPLLTSPAKVALPPPKTPQMGADPHYKERKKGCRSRQPSELSSKELGAWGLEGVGVWTRDPGLRWPWADLGELGPGREKIPFQVEK